MTCCFSTLMVPAMAQELSTTQAPAVPSGRELNRPFGDYDKEAFQSPPKVYYPETWFHYIGGNVSLKGITADLEAIARSGISGIQLFHGQFGGPWPGVEPQIACLSSLWDDAVKHTAEECRRLGLRFTMQNCPGWAMSGGPWIEPSNAMRHLVYSRTDLTADSRISGAKLPKPQLGEEEWRDYKDIAVLAFPTPEGDTGEPLKPQVIKSNHELQWEDCLSGGLKEPFRFSPVSTDNPHWIEVSFEEPVVLRTVEFPSINGMSHGWCYEPGVTVTIQAVMPDGKLRDILCAEMPQASWQDDRPVSFACSEMPDVSAYRISFANRHDLALQSLRLFSAARQNNWEAEAGWTLRSIERSGEHPEQSASAYIPFDKVTDLSDKMDAEGQLNWEPPKGKWTVLRIGHVNTGMRNGPAPPEGTGWECDKLSVSGPDAQFAGYIGRLSGNDGPLAGGLLNGMLMDSWECKTQTWTNNMENEFQRVAEYSLRKWLPAVFGYVVNDTETTKRFLRDWRATLGDLFTNRFYGRMAEHAKNNGMSITYETAAGDIFPADILEYYKYADVPMCEFWQPLAENYVGSLNFKPVKPTASAARIYGKPRVAAEAFTSFALTWDEHLDMLKEVANINSVEGVTHLVFHTYTHNPQTPFLPPGTSFGSGIGTPFLRGQTWWKYMPELNAYLARCSYLLERGKPVSDVLWYLGDEMNHKPDQEIPFPEGFRYDYCNPDVLLNRLAVHDGMIVTPEGIRYRVLWMPDAPRMLPQTLEKLYALINEGATVIGDAPEGLITLTGGKSAQQRFDVAVNNIWGKNPQKGIRKVGKGMVLSEMSIGEALQALEMEPDVKGGDALWVHRRIDGADWYFVCAPEGKGFKGTLDFRSAGAVELWDPVTGTVTPKYGDRNGNRTSVSLDLLQAGSCFLVFRPETDAKDRVSVTNESATMTPLKTLGESWTLSYPSGWGAPPYRLDVTEAIRAGTNTLMIEVTGTWFNRLVYDARQPEEIRKTWTINGPSKDAELRDSGLLGPVVLSSR
ncbi:MAG TPA: hypothetical protein DEQ30_10825 [Porphyromonadaceae bacterium]|nr:hypothetical protein [Porphyromonadaceae bacterium]